jgi:hypothetical protein
MVVETEIATGIATETGSAKGMAAAAAADEMRIKVRENDITKAMAMTTLEAKEDTEQEKVSKEFKQQWFVGGYLRLRSFDFTFFILHRG